MASTEAAAQQPLPCKTVVLRVSIHCEGCKKKVKKVFTKVEGVYKCDIDSVQHKVTVTGDVDADTLIRRLYKSGKQAYPWPEPKKPDNIPAPNPPANDDANKSKGKEQPPQQPKDPDNNSDKKQPAAPATVPSTDAAGEGSEKKNSKEDEAAEKPKPADPASNKGNEKDSGKAENTKENAAGDDEAAAAEQGANDNEGEAAPKKKEKKKKTKKAEDEPAAKKAGPAAVPIARSTSLPVPPEHMYPYGYGPMYGAPSPLYRTMTQPAYVTSYNMAQPPAPSVTSYYAPHLQATTSMSIPVPVPVPQPPQQASGYSYDPYSSYNTPAASYQDYTYRPYGGPPPQDLFYGPTGSRSSQPPPPESYNFFNDENPNSCNLM